MNSSSSDLSSVPIAYPFTAVVGHTAAKRALLLLAVEPALRGALIASESGSGKSTLARAFASLLSKDTSPFAGHTQGELVELPIGITEDRLLGGLDLEETLAKGKRSFSRGLLSKADGGVLHVDDINLLDPNIAAHIAHAMDAKQVRIEREGLSAIHAADFILIGTYNAVAVEPSSLLLERVGLIVDSRAECSVAETAEIIDLSFRFESNPLSFADEFALETAEIKGLVEGARARLPRVCVARDQVRQIAAIAIELGVEGNRPDIFALKAARANAALAGRVEVKDDDIVAAVQFVLVPRATTLPQRRSQEPGSKWDESQREDEPEDSAIGPIEDSIIEAVDARLPNDLLSNLQPRSPGSRTGKRFRASRATRGRYARSSIHRPPEARVAIDATLRVAAPFQLSRRVKVAEDASTKEFRKLASCAISAKVRILPSDLRFKEFKHRSGILFIFAVDASGSMAWNRMAQAKGALRRLLAQAYLHRDKVALISFRGESAEALLGPTRSVELAKRLVDTVPAGGGTPVSAGVIKAIELARLARIQGMSQSTLVLFTDGRANVTLREGGTIEAELRQLAELLRSEGMASVVVDTKSKFVSIGDACRLAQTLGSRYVYLPGSDAPTIYKAIESIVRRHRSRP